MDEPHALWTPDGWRPAPPTDIAACRLPAIANLHSHAFQRAMAGLAERRGGDPDGAHDSFWTWRETMYRMAARFDPDTLQAVAAQLYVEMLEAGYGSVCEFHYLHHAPDGRRYDDPTAMSRALIAAAREAGIRLSLLPVLYVTGGFDGRPLSERQRRFGHDVDGFLGLLETLRAEESATLRIGCAFHSLRAVPEDAMRAVHGALPADMPLHIHVAEQVGEVQDSLALRDARPVEWLLDRMPVDARWTLVHATHLVDAEVRGIADSGATVALCPTTEANLGDGLFPLRAFLDAGGRIGIGSDSHVSVSPVEELRWLEYGQRLAGGRRNVAASPARPSVGEALLAAVTASAGDATGQWRADRVPADRGPADDRIALEAGAPQLAAATPADLVDRWVFAGNRNLVREVVVAGQRVVAEGRHRDREAIAARYRRAMARLLAD
ncbi:MAG: formimidoylglutamate deiminase [Gammaproteobacteria bacterium]